VSEAAIDPAPGGRIGHNGGPPLDAFIGWKGFCWRRAQAAAFKPPGPEIARLRLRRAQALGLTYRQYQSILMHAGKPPAALVFDSDALARPGAREKLIGLAAVRTLVVTVPGGAPFPGAVAMRNAGDLHALLRDHAIKPILAAMIHARPLSGRLAEVVGLAACIPAADYFTAG
jgi:hypothetical protein